MKRRTARRRTRSYLQYVAALALGVTLTRAACAAPAAALAPSAAAKTRAALYQEEACKEFTGHNWTIARNQPGEFIAVHLLYSSEANFSIVAAYGPRGDTSSPYSPRVVAHVTVRFQPVSDKATTCTVRAVRYITLPGESGGKLRVIGPADLNDAENTNYLRARITAAEKRLIRHHPEYGG